MSRIYKAIQRVGDAFGPPMAAPTIDSWIHSTVTTSDATSSRWVTPKAAEYVAKLRQWPMILADKNAAIMAATPMRLYRMTGGKAGNSTKRHLRKVRGKGYTGSESEIEKSAALDILAMPNQYESGQSFSYLKHFCKQAAGNYYRLWDNDTFFTMRPQFTRPVIDRDDPMIRGFAYSRERSNDLIFSRDDVDHFLHRPSIDNPYIGIAPMQACIEYQNLMLNATLAEGQRWLNGGRPPYAIKLPDTLTPIAVEQAKQAVKRELTGALNSGKPLVGQLAEIINFGFPPNEMEYLEGQGVGLLVICNAYGVPISLVDHNAAKDSVSNQAMRAWVDGTIWPLLCDDAADETRAFRAKGLIGEQDFFAYDAPTDEDREDLVRVLQMEVDSGFTLADEAREELGRDPLPNGLGQIPRFRGNVLSDKPTQPAPTSGDPNQDKPPKSAKSLDSVRGKDGDASRVKEIAATAGLDERDPADLEQQRKTEERTRNAMIVWFLLCLSDVTNTSVVIGNVPRGTSGVHFPISESRRNQLNTILSEGHADAIRQSIAGDAASYKLPPISPAKPSEIVSQERMHAVESIVNTTQNDIIEAIRKGISEGKTVQQVAEDLKAIGYPEARAELIAQTEIAYASEIAAKEFAIAHGLGWKTLYLGPGPCPECVQIKTEEILRGGSTPTNEPYTLNGQGVDGPLFHPRCYCTCLFHNRPPNGGV